MTHNSFVGVVLVLLINANTRMDVSCGQDRDYTIPACWVQLSPFLRSLEIPAFCFVRHSLDKRVFKDVEVLVREHLSFGVLPCMPRDEVIRRATEALEAASNAPTATDSQREVLSHLQAEADTVFGQVRHRLKFLPASSTELLRTFFSLPSAPVCQDMFEHLPSIVRRQQVNSIKDQQLLSDLVDEPVKPYVLFTEACSQSDLLHLARAACFMQLHPLTMLIGSVLGPMIDRMSQEEFDHLFHMPPSFTASVDEHVDTCVATVDAS